MRHTRDKDGDGLVRHTVMFDDPTEMVRMVAAAGQAGKFQRYLPNPFGRMGDLLKWYGRSDLRSWGHVAQLCSEVWEPGNARVRRLLAKLADRPFIPPRDLRRRPVWRDDSEGDFDLDRFCEGRDAWRGPKKRDVIGRQFLTFVVDVAASYNTDANDMYWRAAVAIAAAETLEQFGYGVEVIAVGNAAEVLHPAGRSLKNCEQQDLYEAERATQRETEGRWKPWNGIWTKPVNDGLKNQDVFAGVWIKRADDPIDLGALTAVCSPWFFRVIFFGMYGLIPGCHPRPTRGHPVQIGEDRMDDATGPAAGERAYLSGVWTEEAAVWKLKTVLRGYADPEWLEANPEGPEPEPPQPGKPRPRAVPLEWVD